MKQWKHDLTRQKKFTSSRFYVRLSAMFGIRIRLRRQVFLSVDNWGKILKTVVSFSVVKSRVRFLLRGHERGISVLTIEMRNSLKNHV